MNATSATIAPTPLRATATLTCILAALAGLMFGLDIGVISPAMFTIMVLMALVTTFMTSPLLEWVWPAKLIEVEDSLDLDLTLDSAGHTNAVRQVA